MIDFELKTERHRKLLETSVFMLKLLALGIVFRLLVAFSPDTYFLQSGLASYTSIVLSHLGIELQTQGALLVGERGSYLITQDCLGWKSMAAFFGLIIASTAEIKDTWKYIAVGLSALAAVNFVRILTTVFLSYHRIISFEIIHTLFWKWGLTAVVFGFWLLYLHRAD